VTARRITQLRYEGRIPSLPAGRYRLGEAVVAYAAILRRASGAGSQDEDAGASSGGDLDAARVRLITAQAEAREMLNARMRAEVVSASDLDVVARALCDAVKAAVLAFPERAAPTVLGLKTPVEVRDVLTALVHAVCAELAAGAVVTTDDGLSFPQ
jgi:phage terminase Nu1 subunit (DNA packaging protein)